MSNESPTIERRLECI